ncbi:MAG: hypothetical protein PHD82_11940 [Candidatus Riflebacteria bacterium]|nr:hypothetical protein [Candidatus Riflebacteria bacterium]
MRQIIYVLLFLILLTSTSFAESANKNSDEILLEGPGVRIAGQRLHDHRVFRRAIIELRS